MFRMWMTLALVCGYASACFAGNLVPNPGFETADQCPSQVDVVTGQVHYASPWEAAGNSPDYFHACGAASVDVPSNAFGTQCGVEYVCGSPYPGAYAGIATYFEQSEDLREYIQVPLTHSLSGGVEYRIRFWVSLADLSDYGIDGLGAVVTNGAVVPGNGVIQLAPQVESTPGSPITDMQNWVKVEGKFFADGGEDHLVLGVFRADNELTIQSMGGQPHKYAYYYIDGVAVATADITDILPGPPGEGGDHSIDVVNAPANSPAYLYCSTNLDGSEINGHPFDLGAPTLMAQTTTDASGYARFTWTGDTPCTGRNGDAVWLEARFDDPASGESSDSGELLWDATTDVRRTVPQVGVVLAPNTPNPFNPSTEISFELATPTNAVLKVYDMRGRVVRTLVTGRFGAGLQTVLWDGTRDDGTAVSSGVYAYQLQAEGRSWTRRMTLLK